MNKTKINWFDILLAISYLVLVAYVLTAGIWTTMTAKDYWTRASGMSTLVLGLLLLNPTVASTIIILVFMILKPIYTFTINIIESTRGVLRG
ncbi:MAG: hypothetical protein V3U92_19555 [Cellulophaga sp.]